MEALHIFEITNDGQYEDYLRWLVIAENKEEAIDIFNKIGVYGECLKIVNSYSNSYSSGSYEYFYTISYVGKVEKGVY